MTNAHLQTAVSGFCLLLWMLLPGLVHSQSTSQVQTEDHSEARAEARSIKTSVTLDRHSAYPGEQVLITFHISAPAAAFSITHNPLTLSTTENVDDRRNELIPVRQQKYQTNDGSLRWQHIKTNYVLFARTVGTISINPVTVRATLPITPGSGEQHNPKISSTTPIRTVTIQTIPGNDRIWLASSKIDIASEWSTDPQSNDQESDEDKFHRFTVGEPTTRHIRITADAQQAAAIPELTLRETDGVRWYSGDAQLETSKHEDGLIGVRRETMTIVPVHPGDVTLPAITIDWWDINNRQWKKTILPAETITVNSANNLLPASHDDAQLYRHISMILGGVILLLLCSCAWLAQQLRMHSEFNRHKRSQNIRLTEKQAWKQLQKSLTNSQLELFRQSLDDWLLALESNLPARDSSIKSGRLRRLQALLTLAPELGESISQWEHLKYAAASQQLSPVPDFPDESRMAIRRSLSNLRKTLRAGSGSRSSRAILSGQSTARILYPNSKPLRSELMSREKP